MILVSGLKHKSMLLALYVYLLDLTDSNEPIQLPYIERSPTDFRFFQIGDHVRLKFGRPSVH